MLNAYATSRDFKEGDIVRFRKKLSSSHVPCVVVAVDATLVYVKKLTDGVERKFYHENTEKFI